MTSKLLSLLQNVKLTVTEWVAVSVAVVIGGLVAALKVQGSLLHKAQLKLLDQNLAAKQEKASEQTQTAQEKYDSALAEYLKTGGKLAIFMALALGAPARSESNNPNLLPLCQSALSACDELVKAKTAENNVLKDSIAQWKKQAEKGESVKAPVILSSVLAGAGGGALTGYVGGNHNGLIVGGAVGAVVGLGIGLLIDGVR